MTEQEQAQASGAKTPAGDPGAQAPAAQQQTQTPETPKSDADWKRLRLKAEKENQKLRDEIDALKQERKTEDEKKLDAARAEGRKEVESQLAKERIEGAARRALIAEGVDEDLVHVLLAKGEGLDTPEEASASAKAWAADFKTKFRVAQEPPRVQGQAGSPSGTAAGHLTLADVRKMTREEYIARGKEIQEGIEGGRIR